MPHIGVGKMEADKLVPGDRVREAITEVEVVKVKVDHIHSSFEKHVIQNVTDFKELHLRLSKLREEMNEDVENTWKELDRLNRWKWMMTGILLTLTFAMTLFQTYVAYIGASQ